MSDRWTASVDWTAHTPDPARVPESILDALADRHAGAVTLATADHPVWGTTFTVTADTLREATVEALDALVDAAGRAGQSRVRPVRVEVLTEADSDRELAVG